MWSVPTTPLGVPNSGHRGTPCTPEPQGMNGQIPSQPSHPLVKHPVNAGDLQASLSRLPYNNASLTYNSLQPGMEEIIQVGIIGNIAREFV